MKWLLLVSHAFSVQNVGFYTSRHLLSSLGTSTKIISDIMNRSNFMLHTQFFLSICWSNRIVVKIRIWMNQTKQNEINAYVNNITNLCLNSGTHRHINTHALTMGYCSHLCGMDRSTIDTHNVIGAGKWQMSPKTWAVHTQWFFDKLWNADDSIRHERDFWHSKSDQQWAGTKAR